MANMESLAWSMANEELPARFVLITLGHHTAFAATLQVTVSFGRLFHWVNQATVTSSIVNDACYLLYFYVFLRRCSVDS